ncbi:MAG: hypothetical protein WCZ66_09410 [Sphingomonadaceae bacterium]
MSRFPLWLTLLPLVAGVVIWHLVWKGYANDFKAEVAAILPPATQISSSGFPYRLEVDVQNVDQQYQGPSLTARVRADTLIAHRVPWQKDRQVLNFVAPEAELALVALPDVRVRIAAPHAQASLRTEPGRIARLSAVWEQPEIRTGLFAAGFTATSFEAHLRETPATAAPEPSDPRLPTQAQLVLSGTDLRHGDGAPLNISLSAEITAAMPIRSYAIWAAGGTVEIEDLRLTDPTGEILRVEATLVPDGEGRLRIAGTLETVCPATIRAAASGQPAPHEMRARTPELLAFSGRLPGEINVAPAPPGKPAPPVRGQLPPCPALG